MEDLGHETRRLLGDIRAALKKSSLLRQMDEPVSDWRTYQQERARQIKRTMRALKPVINKSVMSVIPKRKRGRKAGLNLEQKVTILIVQQLIGTSSRDMTYMLVLFSAISGLYLGYKIIERLYSDNQVYLALLKMRELLFKEF